MLIKEVCTRCNLTKKAVEYYEEQGMIHPRILENGYRDFSHEDVICLKKIAVLRKLSVNVEDIKLVLSDKDSSALQRIAHLKEMEIEREQARHNLLERLINGENYDEMFNALNAIEYNKSITEKLMDKFPGCYGRFLAFHFSSFLNEPIITERQQQAFKDIVSFLDAVPNLIFPNDLQVYLNENIQNMSEKEMCKMRNRMIDSVENPELFIKESKEALERYIAYKKSNEYKNTLECKLTNLIRTFGNSSGYYDVFIPAMRKLSGSYNEYQTRLEELNERMTEQFPEIQNW